MSVVSGDDFKKLLSTPRIAASFWQTTDIKLLKQHCAAGLEIAEIRLDMAATQDATTAQELIAAYSLLPTILTIRPTWEGGGWQHDEATRARLFCELTPLCAAVDIELAADILPQVAAVAKQHNKALIISRHNFGGGDDAADILRAARHAFDNGADIFKNACMVNNENDFCALQLFLQKWRGGLAVITGMGESEFARRARLQLPQSGSRIAFAAIDNVSAPGQLSLAEMARAIR